MAGKLKHMERSRFSYNKGVDFSGFERKATLKSTKKANHNLVESFLGMFKRQKKEGK